MNYIIIVTITFIFERRQKVISSTDRSKITLSKDINTKFYVSIVSGRFFPKNLFYWVKNIN